MGVLVRLFETTKGGGVDDTDADRESDVELVAACASGDTGALSELFDRHVDSVYRHLTRLSWVDDHAVDDLVQDTFLAAFEGASTFNGSASVRTWLLGVASNLARMRVRTDVRRRQRGGAYVELSARDSARPDQDAETAELMARCAAAVGELPHDQRVAFLMCDVEEVRGRDAAAALGVPEGTLYRRLHQARRALRSLLSGGGR